MAIYQYNIVLVPRGMEVESYNFSADQAFEFWEYNWWKDLIDADPIRDILSKNLPLVEWSKNYTDIANFGNDETNDLCISLKEVKYIEDIHVRIDLREIDKTFVELVFHIAGILNCILVDRKGQIIECNFNDLSNAISKSNAFKFVTDPEKFLEGFSKGDIKIE